MVIMRRPCAVPHMCMRAVIPLSIALLETFYVHVILVSLVREYKFALQCNCRDFAAHVCDWKLALLK
jgi:hypothetical protein